jgi:hypothetical protein
VWVLWRREKSLAPAGDLNSSSDTDKSFGLVDLGQRVLEGNTTVGRKVDNLKSVIPNIHETSCGGLNRG